MDSRLIINRQFHPNGTLAYIETIRVVGKEENKTVLTYDSIMSGSTDGSKRIRVGVNAKYYDNGVCAWMLVYDQRGRLVDSGTKRRRNGEIIPERVITRRTRF